MEALADQFRSRITSTIRESEGRTVFEDLRWARRRARQLVAALAVAVVSLVLAIGAGVRAKRSEQNAVRESQRAERQAAIATAKSWELIRRLRLAGAGESPDWRSLGTANSVDFLGLINETIRDPSDADAALNAAKILQCFGPHRGPGVARAFEFFFSTFESTADEHLRRELAQLKLVYEADQKGGARPKVLGVDRCEWYRRYSK